jgi:poly(beta-D-mannuronate) lyase
MKPTLCTGMIWVYMLAGFGSARAADAALKSPWDSHPVAITDAPFACPAVPKLPRDFATNSYYIDSHHSIIDPTLKKRYDDSVAGIDDFSRTVVKAADAFQTTGSRAAAECVVTLLEDAAKEKVLAGTMESYQATYVQGWALGAYAVAYLKIRGSGVVPADAAKEITKWMRKLAGDNQDYYDGKRRKGKDNDSYNNHLYWAGFAITAAAAASNDHGLLRWGVDAYKQGVRDIRDDGTLPLEMNRGQRALHYHLYALAPLVMIAEFGEVNGIDLYAERDYAIKRLVARCVAGLQDPSFFQQRTGVQQVTSAIESWQVSWAQPYTRRFPDPKISELMGKAPWLNYTSLGGLPPP